MLLSRLIPLAAVLAVAGCSGADVLRLDPTPRPQTHPDSVPLIAQEPQQPYTVVALVSATSSWFGDARTRLLKEAARLGGEAVLLDNGSLTRVGSGENQQQQLTGKVIVFVREPRSN